MKLAVNFPKLAKPAQRALHNAGLFSLEHLSTITEKELGQLHGIGPNALKEIKETLVANGLSFKKTEQGV